MSSATEVSVPLHDCPLCELAAVSLCSDTGDYAITCTRCGYFTLTDCARALVQSLAPSMRTALTRAVQDAAVQGGTTRITVQNVAQLVAPYL